MLKTRVILLVSAVALIAILFTLPRVVVENESNQMGATNEASSDETAPAAEIDVHTAEIDADVASTISSLKENLRLAENSEKSIIFADSLAKLYEKANKYDSAAKFFEIISDLKPNEANWLKTGDTYYEAYGFAMDPAKRESLGVKARDYFKKVLVADENNLSAQNKIAMTYLSNQNPMQGIMMLREILVKDPQNQEALFNLGILSMQSGQHDKAVERFSRLVELYPSNTQAQFFLGVSYLEIGNKEKAKEQFKLVKSLDNDPAVQASADSYLEEIE